jgi:hypothetical protein
MADFRTEFPDFPEADIPGALLSAPWEDVSWHNDACPNFERDLNNGAVIRFYVDFVDIQKREIQEEYPRFHAWVSEDNGDCVHTIETDDLAAALAWADEQAAKTWPRAPLTDAERAHFEGGRLV